MRPAPRQIPKVADVARETPEVVECHRVTGEDCFYMKLHVRSVEHLEEVIDRFTPYGQTTTSIIQSSPVARRGLELAPERELRCDVVRSRGGSLKPADDRPLEPRSSVRAKTIHGAPEDDPADDAGERQRRSGSCSSIAIATTLKSSSARKTATMTAKIASDDRAEDAEVVEAAEVREVGAEVGDVGRLELLAARQPAPPERPSAPVGARDLAPEHGVPG